MKNKNHNKWKFSKLKTTDQLIDVLTSLGVQPQDYLGSGCTATVFRKDDQAIKVCRKSIRYFSNFPGNPQSFKDHINRLGHIFLPVNEILYEDRTFFVYSQNLCQPLKKTDINPQIAAQFLQLFQAMLKENCIISGLSPRNLCFYQGQLFIYDYHGLHTFKTLQSGRIARNLVKYLTLAYCPKKYSHHKAIMKDFNHKNIDKLNGLPSSFIQLLKLMLKSKYSNQTIIRAIDQCIQQLQQN